jgi:hypothetical protein
MSPLFLERTSVTPEIRLEPARGTLFVSGECYPENPIPFFGQLFATLQLHLATRPPRLEVTLRLSYVNSASTKAFRKLLTKLDEAAALGTRVKVLWEHETGDETIAELGQDLVDGLHQLDFEAATFDQAA